MAQSREWPFDVARSALPAKLCLARRATVTARVGGVFHSEREKVLQKSYAKNHAIHRSEVTRSSQAKTESTIVARQTQGTSLRVGTVLRGWHFAITETASPAGNQTSRRLWVFFQSTYQGKSKVKQHFSWETLPKKLSVFQELIFANEYIHMKRWVRAS